MKSIKRILIVVSMLMPLLAQPMKRTHDGAPEGEPAAKRQKVVTVKFKLAGDEEVGIPLSIALQSVTIKNMLEDLGEEIPDASIPLGDVTKAAWDAIVACLETEDDEAMKVYVNQLAPDVLHQLVLASNYLDVPKILQVSCQAWSAYAATEQAYEELKNGTLGGLSHDLSKVCCLDFAQKHDLDAWLKLLSVTTMTGCSLNPKAVTDTSLDGQTRVSGYEDGSIKLFKLQDDGSWTCDITLQGYEAFISAICLCPDGQALASGFWDGTINVWKQNDRSWSCETLQGHKNRIFSLDFSSDGKKLVSGSDDNIIKIWQLGLLKMVHGLTLDQAMVLRRVMDAQRAGEVFDLSEHGHVQHIFESLPDELKNVLVSKKLVISANVIRWE